MMTDLRQMERAIRQKPEGPEKLALLEELQGLREAKAAYRRVTRVIGSMRKALTR